MSFVRFAPLAAVPPGSHKSVRIGLRRIVVYNVDGSLHAIEDACAHMKVPLSGGRLKGTRLTCSAHGWVYDVTTGKRIDKAQGCVRTFQVRVEDGEIQVDPAVADPLGGDAPCDETGSGEDEFTPLA